MALPKRRISKTKKRLRRTHWKTPLPGLSRCAKCDEVVAPHRVCPHCGYYKGRKVMET
jgi:large subunit ribosomal protein L32